MGNSRSFRRKHKDNQPTAVEKRIQKRLRKATGTKVRFRMGTGAVMPAEQHKPKQKRKKRPKPARGK